MSADDTVFALSSGAPPAAIAIVRVSGDRAADTAIALTGSLPQPRRATLRAIRDDRGGLVDRGLLLWFPAGESVTGESLVEFHVHGGRAVVARLLDVLGGRPGLRPAEPGEFSRRALLNGRLGLVEAEGLSDLLLAETEGQRRAALAVHEGALGEVIDRWRREVLAASAEAEALIDYADEGDVAPAGEARLRDRLATLDREVAALLDAAPREALRDGLSVVLAGPPNSGKSSLLNRLARREAALVTPLAGTTRDLIEVPITAGGMLFRLTDTAGLRDTDDMVEAMGVSLARRSVATADLMLWLGDDIPPPSSAATLAICARADLPDRSGGGRLRVSSVTGEGVEAVVAWLVAQGARAGTDGSRLSLNTRHRAAVAMLRCDIDGAARAIDLLLVAEHLRRVRGTLDRLTGTAGLDDVMDALFAGFCVGK